jgi:hypothetical protein
MMMIGIICAAAFAAAYAVTLSLGFECLLSLMGFVFTVSGIDEAATDRYPGFIAFCIIAGIVSILLIALIFALNLKVSGKLKYNKYVWWAQMLASCVMAFCLVKPWENLFVLLMEAM